ncbi:MAG: gspD [Acidobacteria bacterium]|nr:gspD [Acidobacteriota bacterium]
MKLQIADFRLQIGVLVLALLAGGCAAGKAFRQGEASMRAGNLDEAVAAYRKAVQAAPDNATYKIGLSRAMQTASRAHVDKARTFEKEDQLEAALGEYKQASEYDPSNRIASAKIVELDRTIRDRIEASRPKPAIQAMRERARAASAEPILNPASREPLNFHFNNVSLRDILNAIGAAHGISVSFDREFADRAATVNIEGVTLEQGLNQMMTMNQLSYKVLGDKSIFVFQDTPPKHAQYDDQVIRTFYLSHADSTEVQQILSTIIRLPGIAVQPAIAGNKTANTITVRGTTSVVAILEKIIEQNDKPRAEVVIDVEILEVDRSRSKTYGLNLSEYALGAVFSPETSPSGSTTASTGTTGSTGTTSTSTGTSTGPGAVRSPAPFNLNTISRGVTTADFYLAVPTAIVRFLESDTNTKVIAKPQLRGAEGTKLTLNLGQSIPVISTSYTPIATGGAGVNPLSSYQYRDVGVNIDMTPTVTLDGDIRLDLTLDDSQVGAPTDVGGVTVPSFVQRKVSTRLRLRDGESNLLAGLLQTNDTKGVSGFPGLIHVPFLSSLFASNTVTTSQTEIVMLLTPHIVRTHDITEADLRPIFIGSQQNLGIGGPPPLIAPQQPEGSAPAPAAAPAPGVPPSQPAGSIPTGNPPVRGPGGTTLVAPPGSSPVPGTVVLPPATPPVAQPAVPPSPAAAEPQPQLPAAPPPPTPAAPAAPAATPDALATTSAGIGSAQVLISPPGPTFRVGGGPYTVPLLINDASRISTVTLTLIFDPTKLRVRSVQEGSFLRAGGVPVVFTNAVNTNRVDITLARSADATGASGTGVLAAILFDAIAPGPVTMTLSGTATGPGGVGMGLRFAPATVTVQ